MSLFFLFREVRSLLGQCQHDAVTALQRDPALSHWFQACVCSAGVHALWLHRLAYWCYAKQGLGVLVALLLHRMAMVLTGIDIHPQAHIGRGVFIDHTGAIIGQTACVGEDCILIGRVCLGSSRLEGGSPTERRHPVLGRGVTLGMNSVVLGAVVIGDAVTIGANSTVTQSVPPGCTVVGSPAKVVRQGSYRFREAIPLSELQGLIARDACPVLIPIS